MLTVHSRGYLTFTS